MLRVAANLGNIYPLQPAPYSGISVSLFFPDLHRYNKLFVFSALVQVIISALVP